MVFDAATIAPLPIAVAFVKLPEATSAPGPTAVLKRPVVLVPNAPCPKPTP